MKSYKTNEVVSIARPTAGAKLGSVGVVVETKDIPEETYKGFCSLLRDSDAMDIWQDFVPVVFFDAHSLDGFYHKNTLRSVAPVSE